MQPKRTTFLNLDAFLIQLEPSDGCEYTNDETAKHLSRHNLNGKLSLTSAPLCLYESHISHVLQLLMTDTSHGQMTIDRS